LRYLERADEIDLDRHKELLIDPYFLGLWLGDGSTNQASITNEDPEVIKYVCDFADEHGMICTPHINHGNNALLLTLKNKVYNHKNQILDVLSHYGIRKDKDIPDDFIYTSVENRLKLLAGLIDTDGSFSKRDRVYTFSQCESRKHIVEKFAFIARSLGFKVTVVTYKNSCKKHICGNKKKSICENTVCARIMDGKYDIPCLIERKKHHWEKKRTYRRLSHFTVEYDGIGDYCGITIDGDHLFLLKDFTIVHNCQWGIPGREGGKPATFNQITSLDLTMSNVIAEYIQLMDKIEQLAGTITGITEQRQGAISTSELVGNVERSVLQSSHITEPLF